MNVKIKSQTIPIDPKRENQSCVSVCSLDGKREEVMGDVSIDMERVHSEECVIENEN